MTSQAGSGAGYDAENLRLAYAQQVENVREAKRLQWHLVYLGAVALGALAGAYQLLRNWKPCAHLMLVAAIACGQPRRQASTAAHTSETGGSTARPGADTILAAASLRCQPMDLRSGDTLHVNLAVPHGPWLVLTAPDGRIFFVISPGSDSARPSLLPERQFRTMLAFSTPVDDLRGWPAIHSDTTQRIFRTPGKYELDVAENWGSDGSFDVRTCYVNYRP
jgi:hypothetical protein